MTPTCLASPHVTATFPHSGRCVRFIRCHTQRSHHPRQAFWDATGQLWATGALAGKFAGAFVSTGTPGGGQESTVINSLSTLAHHGIVYVPLGYSRTFAQFSNVSEAHGGASSSLVHWCTCLWTEGIVYSIALGCGCIRRRGWQSTAECARARDRQPSWSTILWRRLETQVLEGLLQWAHMYHM